MRKSVRFRMEPKNDLSSRADFSFDLIQSLGKAAQAAIEESQDIAELQKKAKVRISFAGSLQAIDITVQVNAAPGVDLSKEELAEAKDKIAAVVRVAVESKMGTLIQGALNDARARAL